MRRSLRTIGRMGIPILCFGVGLIAEAVFHPSRTSSVEFKRVGQWRSFGGIKLLAPTAVAPGPDGSMLITDRDSQRVFKVGTDGKLLATCGGTGQKPGDFRRPFGVASDDRGTVYVADSDNNRIQAFDSQLRFRRIIDPGLPHPEGIAIDGNGGLWISPGEYSGAPYPIVRLNRRGKIQRCIGPKLKGLLNRDERGRIWAADDSMGEDPIMAFDGDGNRTKRFGGHSESTEQVAENRGLVFASDRGTCRLKVFDEDGRQLGAAKQDDIRMPGGYALAPYSMAFDRDGYLWATFLDAGIVERFKVALK